MENTLEAKLLRLAFDPAAAEGEAVNAFLMYRRKNGKLPFLTATKPETYDSTWNLVLGAKNFDLFIKTLSTWKKTPYYVINITTTRERLIDAWRFELVAQFETADEKAKFGGYLQRVFDKIIS